MRVEAGQQAFNVGRHGVLAAGFPESVPATSVDRQCGSSQQALHFAAQGIMAGAYEVAIAAGVEVMSRVPMFSSTRGQDADGPRVAERYRERGGLVSQGISAELIAAKWGLSRADLDRFSAESHGVPRRRPTRAGSLVRSCRSPSTVGKARPGRS